MSFTTRCSQHHSSVVPRNEIGFLCVCSAVSLPLPSPPSSSPVTYTRRCVCSVLFSSWAFTQVTQYEDTAFFNEVDTFDFCGGHATVKGVYHYHSTPGCLQEQAGAVSGEHSPVLGWAYVSLFSFFVSLQYFDPFTSCEHDRAVSIAKPVQTSHKELGGYTSGFFLCV